MAYNKERLKDLLDADRTEDNITELIRLNQGLIFAQLRKFGLYNNDDAISLGYEALYNAIMTYDATKGIAFSTYATVCIYNKLGSYIRSLKAQPQYVQLIDEHTTVDYIEYLDNNAVSFIHKAVQAIHKKTVQPTHKKILDLWIESNFIETSVSIANKVGCSQPYVSRIINEFRKNLKYKLEGKL